MNRRWESFDSMVRELGSLRWAVDVLEPEAPPADPEMAAFRASLDSAAAAVHNCIDIDDEAVVREAWECIAHAQDLARRARVVATAARGARRGAREMRHRTAEGRARRHASEGGTRTGETDSKKPRP